MLPKLNANNIRGDRFINENKSHMSLKFKQNENQGRQVHQVGRKQLPERVNGDTLLPFLAHLRR